MGSTRFPGKVMKVIEEKTILEYVFSQVEFSNKIKKIIIATTTNVNDNIIEEFCKNRNILNFRGSENDVLDRYYKCAKKFNLKNIVRITSDNPLIDPQIIDYCIEEFLKNDLDYISTEHPPTFPQGYAVEVFSINTLKIAWDNAKKNSEREHVTPYFYNNPKKFKIKNFSNKENFSNIRCTLDRENDFEFIKNIIINIKKQPRLLNDVLKVVSEHPEFLNINKNNIYNEGYLKSLEQDKEQQ